MTAETEIRRLLREWAAAIREKDVDAVLEMYVDDIVAFDLVAPLQYQGASTLSRRLREWFQSYDGPIDLEMRDLSVVAAERVAFSHALHRSRGKLMNGERVEMWWRITNGFKNVDGRWLFAHSHSSVPFDMKSGRAMLDLAAA